MRTATLEIESGTFSAVLEIPYRWEPYHPATHETPAWGGFAEYEPPVVRQVWVTEQYPIRRPAPDRKPASTAELWEALDAACRALAEATLGEKIWQETCEADEIERRPE